MINARSLAPFLATLLVGSALAASCDVSTELATSFGVHKAWGVNLTGSSPASIVEDQKTRWIRVLLRRLPTTTLPWKLTIRDRAGRPLQNISSQEIVDDTPFWTDRLPATSLEFYVETDGPAPVRGIEYVALSSEARRPYYSIQGDTPAWKDLFTAGTVPLLLQRRGDSVGMFVGHEGNSVQGMAIWTCTGFVVANDPAILFVTNDHCGGNWRTADDRWTSSICPNATVDFSWDGDPVSREYACKEVVARSPDDDLAVLRLESAKREASPPPLLIRKEPVVDETVSLIHHPAAMSKQASVRCPAITNAVGATGTVDLSKDFAHRCDSEGGSSGAPVLDAQGRLVGIHHKGFAELATSKCDFLNKAIQATRLINLLDSNNPRLTGYKID